MHSHCCFAVGTLCCARGHRSGLLTTSALSKNKSRLNGLQLPLVEVGHSVYGEPGKTSSKVEDLRQAGELPLTSHLPLRPLLSFALSFTSAPVAPPSPQH